MVDDAGDVEQVFRRERHSGKRPRIAPGLHRRIDPPRVGDRRFGSDRSETVQRSVPRVNPRQRRAETASARNVPLRTPAAIFVALSVARSVTA